MIVPSDSNRARRPIVLIVLVLIVVNLAFSGAVVWMLYKSKAQYEANAETQVDNLSKLLQQNVYTLIREIDLTLLNVIDEWKVTRYRGGELPEKFKAFLNDQATRLPTALGLRITNRDGVIIYATDEGSQNVSIAERYHFLQARDNPTGGLVIGKPVLGRISRQWVLPISRRLVTADGFFDGEVHASVALVTISKMFSHLRLGPNGVVSMWDTSTTLARYPDKVKDRDTIGISKPSPQLKALLDSEVRSAHYRATAPTDGVHKTYAINRVAEFPLWVIAGLADSDYLAPWRREVKQMVLIALTFFCLSSVLAWQIYRYWKISRSRISEMVIRETEEQLKAAQGQAHIGSWIKDLESGRYIWSDEAFRIFGLPPQAASPDDEFLIESCHPEDRERLAQHLEQCQDNLTPLRIEYRMLREDGSLRWLHLEGRREGGASRSAERILGFFHDITEHKRGEEERIGLERQILHAQKLESLGILAGGIAHDFNNILLVIQGNASLALAQGGEGAPASKFLNNIDVAATKAADLARQMLAYSGRGKFIVEPLDLNRLIQDMLPILQASVAKKVSLKVDCQSPLPAIEADATQLRQILLNLVMNASEAITGRSGTIRVSTSPLFCSQQFLKEEGYDGSLEEGAHVLLEVADSGQGMDQMILARIFDPFFTTKSTGRGLGMSAVLGIIRGHKGGIKVASAPGQGSRFNILFPAGSAQRQVAAAEAPTADPARSGGRALLVDDEDLVREAAEGMLVNLGFAVVTACDGKEALRILKRDPRFDVVLLDLTMPKMDGKECLRILSARYPKLKVIVSSGFHRQEIAEEILNMAGVGFIQKPYNQRALQDTLRSFLSA